MKKVSLLLFLGLASLTASAQESGMSAEAGRKATFVRNGFWDNWFVSAGAAGTVYFNNESSHANFSDRPTLNGVVSVGKWYNPYFGARLALQGGALHSFYNNGTRMRHQNHLSGHVDVLFNFSNYIGRYNENRFYSFIPYIGIGMGHGFGNDWAADKNNTMSVNAGFLNTFRLSPKLSAFVEVGGAVVDDLFNATEGGKWQYDGIGTASIGLVLKLGGKQNFDEAILRDQGLIDDLNSQMNRLRAENDQLRKRPEFCPECPKVQAPAKVVEQKNTYVPNVVFFRIGSANIDNNQEISIFNTAEYLKNNPSSKVTIIGYADKQTGTASFNDKLSEKRAKNVSKALINKYNISSDRVSVEWKGSSEQPYKENAWNRVAIFFAD